MNIPLIIARYSCVFYIYTGIAKHYVISQILQAQRTVSSDSIGLLCQCLISHNEFRDLIVPISTVTLSTVFAIIVLGTTTSYMGIMFNDSVFAGCTAVVVIACVALLELFRFLV